MTTRITALVKTLPLTVGNYGGILQAWALQHSLSLLGISSYVDTPILTPRSWRTLPRLARDVVRHRRLDAAVGVGMRNRVISNTAEFVKSNIRTVDLYGDRKSRPRLRVVQDVSVLVAGSDQVWRPAYAHVPSYMFEDFRDGGIRKISYAASFGRADLDEFSTEERSRAAANLSRFDAVSVRERNAIDLCRELGVAATSVLDPTLLVDADAYLALCSATETPSADVLVLVLDDTARTRSLVRAIADRIGGSVQWFYPPVLRSRRDFRRNPTRYILPPVEQWLSAIANAKFVITDSYHATLFSIIFRKPFFTLANFDRGYDRFESVLSQAGLMDRLIVNFDDHVRVEGEIDWSSVERSLSPLIDSSRQYLQDALSRSTDFEYDDR